MKRKSQIERAIEQLEGEVAVLQLAIKKLREQQTAAARKPLRVQKPAPVEQAVR